MESLLSVVYIGVVVPAEIIIRPEVGRIPADRLRHLVAKQQILARQIISHAKRLGLARVAQRANGSGWVIANDGQNAAPQFPSLWRERFGQAFGVSERARHRRSLDRRGRRRGSRQKRRKIDHLGETDRWANYNKRYA